MISEIAFFLCLLSSVSAHEDLEDVESTKAILKFNPRLASRETIKETLAPLGLFEQEITEDEDNHQAQNKQEEKSWVGERLVAEPTINTDSQDLTDMEVNPTNVNTSAAEDEDTKEEFEKIGLYVFFGVLGGLAILHYVLRAVEQFDASRRNKTNIYTRIIQSI